MEEHLFRQLQQTLNADPNNPSHHYNLVAPSTLLSLSRVHLLSLFGEFYGFLCLFSKGIYLWEMGEGIDGEESKKYKEKAAEHFLACAKLNPSEAAAFRFLGHYYSQVSADAQRASKCYQRAVTLNPDDFEAGVRESEFSFEEIELKLVPFSGFVF